ncbi:hypothetical protein AB9X41_21830 [Ralstonia solanacearum]|uniref:hypothetical protein n=1 Tax=Ralstonia solanacearum TaxID=305 RepID=UPI003515295E
MDELDLCRIADTLSLTAVAALLAGSRPSCVRAPNEFGMNRYHLSRKDGEDSDEIDRTPDVFDTALQALIHSVESDKLKADKIYAAVWTLARCADRKTLEPWNCTAVGQLDPHATTVDVDDFKTWLAGRGMKSGFFFPDASNAPDYLNPNDPRYSSKLAAAVRAWEAVPNPDGKITPKQALLKWLREHAVEFGLSNEDGNPNETGILEIAKVANWNTGGGAPKTS